jgi:sirohydrochlorin cobaltochelatase
MSRGIVLFAHGSREAGWSAPFDRLAELVSRRRSDARVVVAYLELIEPALDAAVASLVDEGVSEIVVVPVFLAPGGHVKRDLPQIVATLQSRYSSTKLRVLPTIGQADALLEAIAAWVAAEAR